MRLGPVEGYENRVDRLIREAMESGVFEDLEGVGKPIPGRGQKDDDLWWVRAWVERSREDQSAASNDE